jgi:hypothetical protein
LLVGLLADIHRLMNTGARLFPLDVSRRNLDLMTLSSIPVLIERRSPPKTTATR